MTEIKCTCGKVIGLTNTTNPKRLKGYRCTQCVQKDGLEAAMLEGKTHDHGDLTDNDIKKIVEKVYAKKPEIKELNFSEAINKHVKRLAKE